MSNDKKKVNDHKLKRQQATEILRRYEREQLEKLRKNANN